MKPILLSLVALLLIACGAPANDPTTRLEFFSDPETRELDLPFSAAVRVDNLLFLSGSIGLVPESRELAAGGIEAETRQTMENIKTRVERFGSSMNRIVKCTVFLADMSEWPAMNDVYRSYFETPPARSALGANGLALGSRVEIDCIAVID